jgi:D-glycero-D-manno-heptose 1,7-bisphosphate phosphatase
MSLVLLDRDGVLVEERENFVKHPGELVLIPGAAEALARLNRAGHTVAVCTNQSCVGRGIISAAMLDRIHEHLRDRLAESGARIDALYACPDAPWAATERRKPRPGMLREALQRFRADPAATPMVGDTPGDMQAALAAGCRRVLVRTGHGAKTQAAGLPPELAPVAVHADLAAFVETFLSS